MCGNKAFTILSEVSYFNDLLHLQYLHNKITTSLIKFTIFLIFSVDSFHHNFTNLEYLQLYLTFKAYYPIIHLESNVWIRINNTYKAVGKLICNFLSSVQVVLAVESWGPALVAFVDHDLRGQIVTDALQNDAVISYIHIPIL